MNAATAQICLTLILLTGSIIFVVLGEKQLAIALVGAVAGQGATVGVQRAVTNGNGKK